jgi:hypothetical protein
MAPSLKYVNFKSLNRNVEILYGCVKDRAYADEVTANIFKYRFENNLFIEECFKMAKKTLVNGGCNLDG